MSSSKLLSCAVVLAGLVAALSLPQSARAQSVTPDRALLNQLHAITTQAPAAAQPAVPGVIDGERALLNRSQTINRPVASATPVAADAPVDGVKALLNRSNS